jgi:hypothetical protein
MEEKKPLDLTYGANRWWAIKIAFIWTLFMVPSEMARLSGNPDFKFPLLMLGMLGLTIIFVQGFTKLVGVPLREFKDLKLPYPWGLMLGICGWHLIMWFPLVMLLASFFEPRAVIGGTVGGTPG